MARPVSWSLVGLLFMAGCAVGVLWLSWSTSPPPSTSSSSSSSSSSSPSSSLVASFTALVSQAVPLVSATPSATASSMGGACGPGPCAPPPLMVDQQADAELPVQTTGLPVLPKNALVMPVADESLGVEKLLEAGMCVTHWSRDQGRGPGGLGMEYSYLANSSVRQDAQVHLVKQGRLRMAMHRYLQGENLTVAFLGGSVTAGEGAMDGDSYVGWSSKILAQHLGPRVTIHNGAVPGTVSHYMSACHNVHVPADADIIFVEYSINDEVQVMGPILDLNGPQDKAMDHPRRRPYERLLRKLLNYPRRPAVILLHSFMWFQDKPYPRDYYASCERDFHEFALFYDLSEISVKAACWDLMNAGVEGFRVGCPRSKGHLCKEKATHKELKGKAFYWDLVHPDGSTGHKVMAELAMQPLLDAVADLRVRPLSEDDQVQARNPLPAPMLPNNFESVSNKCFIGLQLIKSIVGKEGWEWKAEAKSIVGQPTKFGFISETPGSVLKIAINSTLPSAGTDKTVVELAHLKSYESMGKVAVTCESGCACSETVIDGHHSDKTSQLFLEVLHVSQSDHCVLALTVLPETSSGKHKFKVSGVMVSEEANDGGIKNSLAVEMVEHAVATEPGKGVFEMKIPLG